MDEAERRARHAARHVRPLIGHWIRGEEEGVRTCVDAIFEETGVWVSPHDFNNHDGWGTDADAMWERVRSLPPGRPPVRTIRFVERLVASGVIRLSHLQPSLRRIMAAVQPWLEARELDVDGLVDALVDCRDVEDVMGDDADLRRAFEEALRP